MWWARLRRARGQAWVYLDSAGEFLVIRRMTVALEAATRDAWRLFACDGCVMPRMPGLEGGSFLAPGETWRNHGRAGQPGILVQIPLIVVNTYAEPYVWGR